tara:strand:- start:296 stop:988 length:693 start_codon:yes stop_codon:yes gene_type:complete
VGEDLELKDECQINRGGPAQTTNQDPDSGPDQNVVAIVLAAGRSLRMGPKNKLLEKLGGKSILHHVVTALQESQIKSIVVVLGHEAAKIKNDLEGEDVTYVMNPDYEQGIGTSISTGIRSVDKSTRGALIMLGDMPVISAKTIDKLVHDFNRNPQAEIVVPTYEDQSGNPVLWSTRFFPQLSSLSGDRGGKPLIEKNTDVVSFCSVDSESVHIDVDNSDELERLRATVGS